MSTTYLRPAIVSTEIHPSHIRRNVAGIAGLLTGVVAAGAALAIFLAPAAPAVPRAVALPAMDASMGFVDHIHTRPAISLTDGSQGYWDVVDSRPAISAYESMLSGFVVERLQGYQVVAPVPLAATILATESFVVEGPQGYQAVARTEAAAPSAMPASLGHWDFSLSATRVAGITAADAALSPKPPTSLGFWDLIP